ncbi:MAG: thrombospondin type 3 repeat-containing protein, partial [Phycisphaerae bacterium]|nr:thrombospondin type 3 repeat-containing protein [Phycisphaerae bacterium]
MMVIIGRMRSAILSISRVSHEQIGRQRGVCVMIAGPSDRHSPNAARPEFGGGSEGAIRATPLRNLFTEEMKMRNSKSRGGRLAAAVMVWALVGVTSANAEITTEQTREVRYSMVAFYNSGPPDYVTYVDDASDEATTDTLGSWNETKSHSVTTPGSSGYGRAYQSSDITLGVDGLSGSGQLECDTSCSSSCSSSVGDSSANTDYTVRFVITQDSRFDFSGSIQRGAVQGNAWIASSEIYLYSYESGTIASFSATGNHSILETLSPGTYEIRVYLELHAAEHNTCNSASVSAQASFNFTAMELIDSDGDGLYDTDDNCPNDYNPGQEDADGDGVGDLCDLCPGSDDNADIDGDEIPDECDNCPNDYNPGQEDVDTDLIGDVCDNCPNDNNPLQEDRDNDGVGDICDNCPDDPDNDADADGFCSDVDNCPNDHNPGQEDVDGDLVGDVCDNCPNTHDPTQQDTDGDGVGNVCDDDDDNDGVLDGGDTDPLNPDVCEDADGDGCDDCSVGTDNFGPLADNTPGNDGPDGDADGLCDSGDLDEDITDTAETLIIPEGSSYLMGGSHSYSGDVVIDGILYITPYDGTGTTGIVDISAASITVGPNGVIQGDARGYRGGGSYSAGSGAGQKGAGGGYGGNGDGSGGSPYGTQCGEDIAIGSGGGGQISVGEGPGGGARGSSGYQGGAGGRGGACVILAADQVHMDGVITVNGENGHGHWGGTGGSGSGGGILINGLSTASIFGHLSACGGSAGKRGGGGRIKVFGGSIEFTGTTAVLAGIGGSGAENGTVCLSSSGDVSPDCNSNGILDQCDIDCGETGGLCDVPGCGASLDCNTNGIPDDCEVPPIGDGPDCNTNGIPDECDPDSDSDGVPDDCDNCPNDHNPGQTDSDGDGMGDVCDPWPNDPDTDHDGINDDVDNCPNDANADQADADSDDVGDVCDNCPNDANADQADADSDDVGDVCDNCPNDHNPGQEDTDGDGMGDVCDSCNGCLIDEACYGNGDPNPANDCQYCDIAQSTTSWTNRSSGYACGDPTDDDCTDPDTCDEGGVCLPNHADDGTLCDDGLFCNENETCTGGVCGGGNANLCSDDLDCTTDTCNEDTDECDHVQNVGTCLIDGVCYDDGDLNPANDCQECNSTLDPLGWSNRTNGTTCDDGLFCNENETCTDGVCGGGNANLCSDDLDCTTDTCNEDTDECDHVQNAETCLIDDVCYNDGNLNPANDCQECNSTLDPLGWSNRTNGTSCDDGLFCNENETCTDGVCGGGNANLCDDSLDCTTDSCNEDTDTCEHTTNVGTCLIDEVCYGDGAVNPANDCEECNSSLDQFDWSNRANGSTCDDGLFCNENETCTGGVCGGGNANLCNDDQDCTADTCNEDTDECEHLWNADLTLNVAAGSECVDTDDTITVTLDVACLSEGIDGVQALIHYDTSLMTLVGITAESPWQEIVEQDTDGDIIWAAYIPGSAIATDGIVATLVFDPIAEGATNVTFQPDDPPFHTKLTRSADSTTILPDKADSGVISIDDTVATASNNGPFCEGDTFVLSGGPSSGPLGPYTYAWTGPDGFISTDQSPTISDATLVMTGTYYLTVTNINGCEFTAQTDVEVYLCMVVNVEVEGLIGDGGSYGPPSSDGTEIDRDVTFVFTDCDGATGTHIIPITFTADVGNNKGVGSVRFEDLDAGFEWLGVQEGHTLRKRVAVDFAGTLADSVTVFLTSGD